ncbi:Non-specific serine/threonine protein kinase [Bertholletia excelsa]
MADWSDGYVRETALNCGYGDGFLKYSKAKVHDTSGSWFDLSMTTKEREIKCLENCSCSAYANTNVRGGGSGCLLWFGDLVDIRDFSEGGAGSACEGSCL